MDGYWKTLALLRIQAERAERLLDSPRDLAEDYLYFSRDIDRLDRPVSRELSLQRSELGLCYGVTAVTLGLALVANWVGAVGTMYIGLLLAVVAVGRAVRAGWRYHRLLVAYVEVSATSCVVDEVFRVQTEQGT